MFDGDILDSVASWVSSFVFRKSYRTWLRFWFGCMYRQVPRIVEREEDVVVNSSSAS